jgi:hypothetical protein
MNEEAILIFQVDTPNESLVMMLGKENKMEIGVKKKEVEN